jgi:hypothetical protein
MFWDGMFTGLRGKMDRKFEHTINAVHLACIIHKFLSKWSKTTPAMD